MSAWKQIGTAAHSIVAYGNRLAALSPDRRAIWVRDPLDGAWTRVGDGGSSLIGGGWDLFRIDHGTSALSRYDGARWSRIGDPVERAVAIAGSVYAIDASRLYVRRWNRFTLRWSVIGTGMRSLIGGGANLYGVATRTRRLHEFERHHTRWIEIGEPAAEWAGVGGTVYALTSDRKAVLRYDGTPGRWTRVGGPMARLFGGGEFLYAMAVGTGELMRYDGTWTRVGPAWRDTAAIGRLVWGLSMDRSAVHEHDPATAEGRRLRAIMATRFAGSPPGSVMRGLLVKRMGGEVLAEHCADVPFQPQSMIKLAPHLHAFREVEAGRASLETTRVEWIERVRSANPNESCIPRGTMGTRVRSVPLGDALPTMMWDSHNRTLDAVLDHFRPRKITDDLRASGMRQTEMYYGCSHAGRQNPWLDNVTTLTDMAALFEGVATGRLLSRADLRERFRESMPTNVAAEPHHVSPITGNTYSGFGDAHIAAHVRAAFGPNRRRAADEFLALARMHGKGGGMGLSVADRAGVGVKMTTLGGHCDILWLRLPRRVGTRVITQDYVIGYYFLWYPFVSWESVAAEMNTAPVLPSELFARPVAEAAANW